MPSACRQRVALVAVPNRRRSPGHAQLAADNRPPYSWHRHYPEGAAMDYPQQPGQYDLMRPPLPGPPQEPRRRLGWPGWTVAAAAVVLAVGFTLSPVSGSNPHDAVGQAAGWLFDIALIALLVAVPAALYRKYHSRRMVAGAPLASAPSAPCYRCGWPLSAHGGDTLECPPWPEGYQPATGSPPSSLPPTGDSSSCSSCGQPFTAHYAFGQSLTCPEPPFA